ncbi:MAG TPA: hypothetical protein VKA68_10935 [bacterium]|nr:hypothetical protein [bacterium]
MELIDLLNFIFAPIEQFLREAFPSISQIGIWTLPLLLFTWLAGWIAGKLHAEVNLAVAYSRKVFHFLIFTMAGVLHIFGHLSLVALYGVIVSCYVVYGVVRGEGYPFYEAVARPEDRPHRTLFILVPLFTTALGGVTSNILFPHFAHVGYLVSGWGDAIAEPVGRKWGSHSYNVPSLAGVPAIRTIEGSISVFIVGTIAAFLALWVIDIPWILALQAAALCGVIATGIESVSTHGIDNFTVQVAVAAVAQYVLLGI